MSVQLHRWEKARAVSALADQYPKLFEHVSDDETAIAYWPGYREFVIPVCDGGNSGIVITYDPFSGKPLPRPLRDERFDALKALGIDWMKEAVPPEFNSEIWWRERGL